MQFWARWNSAHAQNVGDYTDKKCTMDTDSLHSLHYDIHMMECPITLLHHCIFKKQSWIPLRLSILDDVVPEPLFGVDSYFAPGLLTHTQHTWGVKMPGCGRTCSEGGEGRIGVKAVRSSLHRQVIGMFFAAGDDKTPSKDPWDLISWATKPAANTRSTMSSLVQGNPRPCIFTWRFWTQGIIIIIITTFF